MNIIGQYEQGLINIITSSDLKQQINDVFIYKKRISFSKEFTKLPVVLLTIQSIVLLNSSDNNYQTKVSDITLNDFVVEVLTYSKYTEFNIICIYTAFEETNNLKVYYYHEIPTPQLNDYDTYFKQTVHIQKIPELQIDDFKPNSFSSAAFLLGVKSQDQIQDVSISAQAQPLQNDNKVEIIVSTWNNIKIESVSFVVIVWSVQSSFYGEWKGNQYDNQDNKLIDHMWTNTKNLNRFDTLNFNVNLISQENKPLLKLYGIRGYDIREGPLAVICRDINLTTEEAIATAQIGTMGKSKLVAAWVNGILLVDYEVQTNEETNTMMISFAVIGSLIGVCTIGSIFYINFFSQDEKVKHKQFNHKVINISQGNYQQQELNIIDNQLSNSQQSTKNTSKLSSIRELEVFDNTQKKQNDFKIVQYVQEQPQIKPDLKKVKSIKKFNKQNSVILEMSEECSPCSKMTKRKQNKKTSGLVKQQFDNQKQDQYNLNKEQINIYDLDAFKIDNIQEPQMDTLENENQQDKQYILEQKLSPSFKIKSNEQKGFKQSENNDIIIIIKQ